MDVNPTGATETHTDSSTDVIKETCGGYKVGVCCGGARHLHPPGLGYVSSCLPVNIILEQSRGSSKRHWGAALQLSPL